MNNSDRLQLYYWDGGNFGDDLNVWMWNKLIPEIVDTEAYYKRSGSRPLFVGIGTILSEHIPANVKKAIFGSGFGYAGLPILNENAKIYFVRGPLTAEKLGLNPDYAITDAALLIRDINLPEIEKKYRYSFMPHHSSVSSVNWLEVCNDLGIKYLDPTAGFEQSLNDLRASEIVIAEAMHGAILADAFRIPWIAVNLHGNAINSFKWDDWCRSINVKYNPLKPSKLKNIRLIKRKLPVVVNYTVKNFVNVVIAKKVLRSACQYEYPSLSEDEIIEQSLERLRDKVSDLKNDFESGFFNR